MTAVYGVTGVTGSLGVSLSGTPMPGDIITPSITGTYNADTCLVYLDGTEIGTTGTFSGEGTTTFTYQIPYNTTYGSHILIFITSLGEKRELTLNVTAPSPSISIDHETHTVSLSGFAAFEDIELKINGSAIFGITADSDGSASYTPAVLLGPDYYIITARGLTSSFYATASFNVTTEDPVLSANPAAGKPGYSLNLTLSNFGSEEDIRFYWDDNEIEPDSSVSTGSDGSASGIIKIPLHQSEGDVTVYAYGVSSGKSASAVITVNAAVPVVEVEPVAGEIIRGNEDIYISVSDFPPHTQMAYYLDSSKITVSGDSTSTDSVGELQVSYTMPVYTVSGTHSITASGGGYSDSVSFAAEAQTSVLRISAAEGKAGQTITISGSNYIDSGSSTADIYFGDTVISNDEDLDNGSFSVNYVLPSDLPDGIYIIKAVTSESEEGSASFRMDNTAPAVPEVTAVKSARSITVSWTESSDTDTAGYKVFRKAEGIDEWGAAIAGYGTGITSYSDELGQGIEIGTEYTYGVSAFDRLGNESGKGLAETGLAEDTQKPSASFRTQNYTIRLKEDNYTFLIDGSDNQGIAGFCLTMQKYTGSLDSDGNKIYGDSVTLWNRENPTASYTYGDYAFYSESFVKAITGKPMTGPDANDTRWKLS